MLEGTPYILVEMPEDEWSPDTVEDLLLLRFFQGLRPIIVHVERCLPMQNRRTVKRLADEGVLFQCNAAFLASYETCKRQIKTLFRNDRMDLIGSDCHNMRTRKPNIGVALRTLSEVIDHGKTPHGTAAGGGYHTCRRALLLKCGDRRSEDIVRIGKDVGWRSGSGTCIMSEARKSQKPEPFEKKVGFPPRLCTGEEMDYVREAYDANWMSTVGANIDAIEEKFAARIGVGYGWRFPPERRRCIGGRLAGVRRASGYSART